jgi:hypothetical protein
MRTGRSSSLALALVLAVGCATSGVGSGHVEMSGKPDEGDRGGEAVFTWRASADATRGTIEVALPDGRIFHGTFSQTSRAAVAEPGSWWGDADPGHVGGGLHDGRSDRGYAWRYGATTDHSGFVRHYSGRVVAQLDGPEGERMRCSFTLARPEEGPASGGVGVCQVSTGERIERATLRGAED